ncbi:MAG: M56 family metallopeptidase, partial [Flavobacteriaceae bacterium]|nr:M56 family metallopeptidase [Flavobacteriaceae bacterium]
MSQLFLYFVSVIVLQAILYALYYFVYRNKMSLTWNRAYLVISPLASYALPLIDFKPIKQTSLNLGMPEHILLDPIVLSAKIGVLQNNSWSIQEFILLGFILVCAFIAVRFYFSLKRLLQLRYEGKQKTAYGVDYFELPELKTAFSYFNQIYIGEKVNGSLLEGILIHEQAHSKLWHSVDLMSFELQKIVFWWNPLLYFFKKELEVTHEYQADATACNTVSKDNYIKNLICFSYSEASLAFRSHFYSMSNFKQRIIMLNTFQKPRFRVLKKMALLPILALMFIYCSEQQDADELLNNNTSEIVY